MVSTDVRTFVGSRGSSVDTTFTDLGEDATLYGFPSFANYVVNLTAVHDGEPPIMNFRKHFNASFAADGLVGGHLPVPHFVIPISPKSPYVPRNATGKRYWSMIAAGAPDMDGGREQTVWFRFQQVICGVAGKCALKGKPQYYDTYWWSNAPDGRTGLTGPKEPASAAGFYANLLEVRRWWAAELASEQMMELSLPEPTSTNGTYLKTQAVASVIRAMLTRKDTWGPRYGVLPGYGINMQDGFQDTFTTTAQAALELGAMKWAEGLVDHQFSDYVRLDGMINYRGEEIAQSARMLTILALYYSYTGDQGLLLKHFSKAQGIAGWLIGRRSLSLGYPKTDPRYGMLPGDDEADNYNRLYFHQDVPLHFFSSNAESYRAFIEMGAVWQEVGKAAGRDDIAHHGAELLTLAPELYADLHASLNRTVNTTVSPGDRCYTHRVEGYSAVTNGQMSASYRSYPEMFFSGALTEQQVEDMYKSGLGLTACPGSRFMAAGSPSAGTAIFTHVPFGFPHGLLQHDMVERFLLYFFVQSAHANTRGTWTTPESASITDRTHSISYSAAGVNNVPLCLKWMLCFEEPETKTLWLGKATPRDWLAVGEAPISAKNVTTRYGRVSFLLSAAAPATSGYTVTARVTVPASFASAKPAGGLRIRLRAPLAHAGKLSSVTVGGKRWTSFDAAAETVDFAASDLTPAMVSTGLLAIVATFGATVATPLQRASVDMELRALPQPLAVAVPPSVEPPSPARAATPLHSSVPTCPSSDLTLVDHFEINGTKWVACEDLQKPGGAIVLVSSAGTIEWFSKGYEPYGTNATDHDYYLGLGREAVVGASTDVLGAKLLCDGKTPCEPTWAGVEQAVPPIRKTGGGGYWVTTCRGLRTFTGSRGAAIDYSMDDVGYDCGWNGAPSADSYTMALHNKAVGEPYQHWNTSGIADGMIGDGVLPTVVLYYPVNSSSGSRYWTYVNVPKADMGGSREQGQWQRWQQIECAGPGNAPPCKLHDWPMYWDTMWYARYPGANLSDTARETLITGSNSFSQPGGFYAALLELRRYWNAELAAEGMMQLELPSPKTTNGTYLAAQAVHSIVRSMITRQQTWHPRYGTKPGFGSDALHGLPDVFTSTATAALEMGAMAYTAGVVENHFKHYVRDDGMLTHHGMAVPASCRMLTILALYHSYAGDGGAAIVGYFPKAKALAEWLLYRRTLSLSLSKTDPRYGIPQGDAESENFVHVMDHSVEPLHFYASAAEMYRAFAEIGAVWKQIGKSSGRADIAAHADELLATAPLLFRDLHASLNRTQKATGVANAPRRIPMVADTDVAAMGQEVHPFRAYPELCYSGALTRQQVDDIYTYMSNINNSIILGVPGWDGTMSSRSPFGLAFALLQHDMVERFLVHFYALSAHGYTRGTWTTPESGDVLNRDEPTMAYAVPGVHTVPIYLKWMLCFEEPETKTLWLGKATPRDWLAVGEAPISAKNVTTRYGRVSFLLSAAAPATSGYTVTARVTVPASFASAKPAGGLRIRLRAPLAHAGKLSSVTVGGKRWTSFDAAAETVDFAASDLTPAMVSTGLLAIVATFKP